MAPQVVVERAPVGVCSLCSCRLLWLGIGATMLSLGPFMLALAVLYEWIAELPEAYLWNNGTNVVSSLFDFVGTALVVWASEPQRLGRKSAYLFLCCCSVVVLAACYLSGGGASGAYTYLTVKTALSICGGGNPQGAAFAILCAWFANNAPEELHAAGFSVFIGSQFLAMGSFPMLAIYLKQHLGDMEIIGVATAISLLQIPFVIACFPRERPVTDGPAAQLIQADRESPPIGITAVKDIRAAIGWILRNRMAVSIVWLSLQFTGAADSTSIALFLTKGRHFSSATLNRVLGSMGFAGCIINLILVPWLTTRVSKGAVVFIGMLCTVAHVLIYAFFSTPAYLIGFGFIGSLMFASVPALISYMPLDSNSGVSQGVLVGVFMAMKAPANILGPPFLGACLQAELGKHNICYVIPGAPSFVGSGFLVLAFVMLPAVGASLYLLLQERRGRHDRGKRPALETTTTNSQTVFSLAEPDPEVSPVSGTSA